MKAAASRDICSEHVRWEIRALIAQFIQASKDLNPAVYHISRNLNVEAHSAAHQVLNTSSEPVYCFTNSAHGSCSCQMLQRLQHANLPGYVIQCILLMSASLEHVSTTTTPLQAEALGPLLPPKISQFLTSTVHLSSNLN